jgi:hypothetical protein
MNSIDAKNKHCVEIKKNCLAEGCMLWVIQSELEDVKYQPADQIIIDAFFDPENKGVAITVSIHNGILTKRKTQSKHPYDVIEEKPIEWSEHIESRVTKRQMPTLFETDQNKKNVRYNHDAKIWEEKIPAIKQTLGYCAKFKKDFGI